MDAQRELFEAVYARCGAPVRAYALRRPPSLAAEIAADAQSAGRPVGVLARALGELSEVDREVLMLVAWEGLTAAQAGEVLGCSDGAVAMRLHRARRRLATILDRERSEVT